MQFNIHQYNESLDKAGKEMQLNKDDLDEWLKIQNEKEDDTLALLKYTKIDDIKVKETTLAIEKLMLDVHRKKQSLSQEVTNFLNTDLGDRDTNSSDWA